MLLLDYLHWWYGAGWAELVRRELAWLRGLLEAFSVKTLLKTMFSPWKRIITYSDGSIQTMFRAMADNAVSRLVGFGVRMIVLIAGGICLTLGAIAGLIGLLVWPLVPLAAVGCILFGVVRWQW
jgi:hypothetical protein